MASTFCVNCKQPLPAGAAFCGNCGARQTPATTDAATQLSQAAIQSGNNQAPASDPNAPTQLSQPVSPADQAPTTLVPPPPPESASTIEASVPPDHDPYAAQYSGATIPTPPVSGPSAYGPAYGPGGAGPSGPYGNAQAPFAAPPPPPGYAPGPPPVMTPGGVAPWAQPPQKKGRGWLFGCVIAVALVVVLLGGAGVLAFRAITSGNNNSANTNSGQHSGTGTTPGVTPTATTPASVQTLDNLNLQAIYAGVTFTFSGAQQASSFPEYPQDDPNSAVLKIQTKMNNPSTHDVTILSSVNVLSPSGQTYDAKFPSGNANALPYQANAQANVSGYLYFIVPEGSQISDWQVVLGGANEVQEKIPLNGNGYDASVWNEPTTPIGKSVTYYGGALVATVVSVATGVWTPGYQAPTGKRFILVDLKVTNNSAGSVYVGDPEFVLLLPNGDRQAQDTGHGYFVNEALGGNESKDVGIACFLAPPDKGDFQMIFFNQDNGIAGQVDLGTL